MRVRGLGAGGNKFSEAVFRIIGGAECDKLSKQAWAYVRRESQRSEPAQDRQPANSKRRREARISF